MRLMDKANVEGQDDWLHQLQGCYAETATIADICMTEAVGAQIAMRSTLRQHALFACCECNAVAMRSVVAV
jgi:hypothetical protein